MRLAILGVEGDGKVYLTSGRRCSDSGLTGDDMPHEKGVALIVSKEAEKSLKEWESISERIISARFESKCHMHNHPSVRTNE